MVDHDDQTADDLIGELETKVSAIWGAKAQCLEQDLTLNNRKTGKIIVRGEAVKSSNEMYHMQFKWDQCGNNKKMLCCSSSERVKFRFMRKVGSNWTTSYDTPFANQKDTPQTSLLKIPLQTLCNSDLTAEVKIAAITSKGEVNSVTFKVDDLSSQDAFPGAKGGTLTFIKKEIVVRPSFLDYLRSGWTISLTAAVDYTASNGAYTNSTSLHYMGPSNQYEAAIWNVGGVVEPYDSDRCFPVYGFGGIPKHMGMSETSYCFPMNGNLNNPEIPGIEAIIAEYRRTLPSINLSGPTYFTPLLKEF